ncbi:MAG: CBS domain-containing protein [Thiomicrorhabdus sp.]|nr:CBS domain-containing protein [Thiomicrorhabdus sp.]
MFAIYNIDGRRFRDNLENLRKVRSPHNTNQSELNANIAQDETVIIQGVKTEPVASAGLKSYREMLHLNEREPIFHAYQIMQHPVVTLPVDLPIKEAYQLFKKHGYSQMPVSNLQLQIVGILNYKSLLNIVFEQTGSITFNSTQTVEDLMQPEVITADPVSDIRRIALAMVEYELTCMPIVNQQDHLVGIVTRTDFLKAIVKDPPISLWS